KLDLKPRDINNMTKKRVKNSLRQLGWVETRASANFAGFGKNGTLPSLTVIRYTFFGKFPEISTEEKRWWNRFGSVLRRLSRILNLWKILAPRSINAIRWRVC